MRLTRRRLAIVTVAVLLGLDAGRSVTVRLAAANPSSLESPPPAFAVPIAWPPGSDLPAEAPTGARVYATHCATCHGPDGRGNGPAAPALRPKPRDFTGGVFKIKSVPGAVAPTLDDLRATLRRGMPGTSMPGWSDVLSSDEIDAVGSFVLGLGPHRGWTGPERAGQVPSVAWTEASVEDGRRLYDDLGCASCHGASGHGDGVSAKDLEDVWNQPAPPRDLTAPWTFRGGDAREAVYARIAYGISGTPMPGYLEVAEPSQIASVVKYLESIARTPPWKGGTLTVPSSEPVQRGEYLVRAGMCGLCHTPVDAHGIQLSDTHHLAGGVKIDAGGHGIFFSSNLTSDAATGLGTWSAEQIAAAIRTGHAPDRRLNFWAMPWMMLSALTQQDALAIGEYLKTVPPVSSSVPKPLRYGVVETVLRKLTYAWPALVPSRLARYPGTHAATAGERIGRNLLPDLLTWLQIGVLALGMVLLVLLPPALPAEERSGGLWLLRTVLIVAAALALTIVYRYPAVRFLSAPAVAGAIDRTIPALSLDGTEPNTAALLQRGRYLFAISSCAYCHNGNGSGGGKLNWSVFGTTWAGNLTPHSSGLGEWSDAVVQRALASGVARDGRGMHWQAAMWDRLSNYSVEDQQALIAFLRHLPALDRALPAVVPPGPHDCPADTFWVSRTNEIAGCR
jgi:mono/diheme cytochrome c family protein